MRNPFAYIFIWLYEFIEHRMSDGLDQIKDATPKETAERFIQLFKYHHVEISEIPEIEEFAELSLSDLSSEDNLLKKLTPRLLDKAVNYFGIRKEWLRSGEPELYQNRHWYQDGWDNFFEDYNAINLEDTYFPFFIIAKDEEFDRNKDLYQPFVLVLQNTIASIGDKQIKKYQLDGVWHWSHPPCRLRAKAFATLIYKRTLKSIPVYLADDKTFHKITEHYIPPSPDGLKRLSRYFEDYAAVRIQNVDPFEVEEWDDILEHIQESQALMVELKELHDEFVYADRSLASVEPERDINKKLSQQSQAAYKRHEPTNELKRECIYYWLKSNKKHSQAEVARRFYKQLSADKQKLLSPNNAENTLKKSISEYENREKVLQRKKPSTWLVGFEPEK